MSKETEAGILRHCVRFLMKRLEPVEKRLEAVESKEVDVETIIAKMLQGDKIQTLVDLHVAEAVTKHFEANPIRHGEKGDPGQDGQKGEPGADGVNMAGAVIDRDGNLVLTKSNGDSISLGGVIGRDGVKGADGKDGADFSDVEIDYDGERGLIIRGKGGEITKRLPIPIDRGFWREGMKSEKSDVLTCNGSSWIAKRDTDKKPCLENEDDWRMMTRKGRDGPQGPAGKDYKPLEPVKLNG